MEVKDLIVNLVIPDYPDKVLIAKSRRPVYYVLSSSKVRGRVDIPKSYLTNTNKYSFNTEGVLINNTTGEPQLANPQTAGKPRYWVVNFQDIWNQKLSKQSRAVKIDKLKHVLRPYIKTVPKIVSFPLRLEIYIYDIECPVDVSNKGAIYTKVVEDLLVNENVIPDDSAEYINCSGKVKFVKIDDSKDRKMEIRIYRSDNKPF